MVDVPRSVSVWRSCFLANSIAWSTFDAAFCATYEALRDRIWSAHAAADFEAERGYRAGTAALGERPPPACDPVPKR